MGHARNTWPINIVTAQKGDGITAMTMAELLEKAEVYEYSKEYFVQQLRVQCRVCLL
jgi:hypothetical protein